MTIPTLINKTQNHEHLSRLRKVYSTMAQATNKIIFEEGTPKNVWASSISNVYDMYRKHLSVAHDCGSTGTTSCIGYTFTNFGNFDAPYYMRLVLNDGTIVNFAELQSSCSAWGNDICEWLDVDINGIKGPNKPGIDIWAFNLTANGLIPANCDAPCTGVYCTCKVLREGKID